MNSLLLPTRLFSERRLPSKKPQLGQWLQTSGDAAAEGDTPSKVLDEAFLVVVVVVVMVVPRVIDMTIAIARLHCRRAVQLHGGAALC